MKKSRFNLIVPYRNGRTIIFNTRSGGIGLFDNEFMDRYESGFMSDSEKEALARRGMLVNPCKDEDGNTKVYASIIDPGSVMSYGSGLSAVGLHPIESEEEWELIQAVLDHLQDDDAPTGACE